MALRTARWRHSALSPPSSVVANTVAVQCRLVARRRLLQSSRSNTTQTPPSPSSVPAPAPQLPTWNDNAPTRGDKNARRALTALGVVLAFATGWTLARVPQVETAVALATQPSDAKTNELWNPDPTSIAGKIEAQMQAHPLYKQLHADSRYSESRPHLKIPANLRPRSFTGGHLIADDKIPVPPVVFTTGDGKELISLIYLGPSLCGHPGIIHGGLLSTLLDEGLARTCFAALPNKVGVTAWLRVDYRAPIVAGRWVVLRGETTKVDGRKAWVKGRIEALTPDGSPGKLLTEGEAMYVEPKGFVTKLMKITS